LGRILFDSLSKAIINFVLFFFSLILWLIQWSLALIIFTAVIAGTGYYVYTQALSGGKYIIVPKITDIPVMEASKKLTELGLELGPYIPVVHDTVPKYYIISQKPEAGKVVRIGRKVFPVVSAGPSTEKIPDLRGKLLNEAQQIIEYNSKFKLGNIARIPRDEVPETVIAQDPPPDTDASQGTMINLLISTGKQLETYIMPNIVGKPIQEVEELLKPYDVNLVPNITDSPEAPSDIVLEQDPAPDTPIVRGQMVIYTIKLSGTTSLPDARYQAEVTYTMNEDWAVKEVRVELIDRHGNRELVWYKPRLYDTLSQIRYVRGTPINIKVSYISKATVEIFVDNINVASYELEGGNPPRLISPKY